MGVTHLLAGVLLLAAPAKPDARPAVAIAALRTAADINPDVARVVEDRVAEVVRRSSAFSRVVGTRDVEAVLGLEQTRQLVACTQDSCLVELAGALGVEFLLTGQLARVGPTLSLSIKLLNARTAALAGAASATFDAGEAAALAGTEALTTRMLRDAGLLKGAAGPPEAASPESSGGVLGKVVLGLGGVGAAVGGVAMLLALGLVAGGVTTVVLPLVLYIPTPWLAGDARVFALPLGGSLLAGVGGVGLVLGLVLLAVGVASGVAGWTLL